MFPLVVIGVIGGYWLLYDGWQRVSHFSPSNPITDVVNATKTGVEDTVSAIGSHLPGGAPAPVKGVGAGVLGGAKKGGLGGKP